MQVVYLSLGSNLGDSEQHVLDACQEITALSDVTLFKASSLYLSLPMGPQDQGDFINAVIKVATSLPAQELLDQLHYIERKHGRERSKVRWGPRSLDLDILLYGDQVIKTSKLTIPHYDLKRREFVLYPLHEIEPDLILPDGSKLVDLLEQCSLNGMRKLHRSASEVEV